MIFTSKGAQRPTYQCIIGPSHVISGGKWRRKKRLNSKAGSGLTQQQQLSFLAVTGPRKFTRAGVLHTVTKLIATNSQVSHTLPW